MKKIFKPLILIFFIFILSIVTIVGAETITNKKWVTDQSTPNYNSGGYSGILSRYVSSGTYIPSESKFVSRQNSSYYNLNGFSGSLTKYVASGSYTPGKSKYVTGDNCYNTLVYSYNSKGERLASPNYQNAICPSSKFYDDGEFSGTLYRNASPNRYCASKGAPNADCSEHWTATYSATLSKPAIDTRVYLYEGMVTKPAVDTRVYRYQGWVEATVEDPTNVGGGNEFTEGKAKGDFSWKLKKDKADITSHIEINNSGEINGNHFATRNKNYLISGKKIKNERSDNPILLKVQDPNELKGEEVNLSFSYEYTNYYKDIYKCVDTRADGCYAWEFDKRIPEWTRSQTATWQTTLKIDHNYGEDILLETKDKKTKDFLIGRKAILKGSSSQIYHEKDVEHFEVSIRDKNMSTQSWTPVSEQIKYFNSLNQPLTIIEGKKYYFPTALDENLKERYANDTLLPYSDYALPLQISSQTSSSLTTELKEQFFVTDRLGFIVSVPRNINDQKQIERIAKEQFEAYTNEAYNDKVIFSKGTKSKYYIPVNWRAAEKPKHYYPDNMVIGRLGMSDVTLHYLKKLQFENYLFGHVKDEPIFLTQRTSVNRKENYRHSFKLNRKQIDLFKATDKERKKRPLLHEFKPIDDLKERERVRKIAPTVPIHK